MTRPGVWQRMRHPSPRNLGLWVSFRTLLCAVGRLEVPSVGMTSLAGGPQTYGMGNKAEMLVTVRALEGRGGRARIKHCVLSISRQAWPVDRRRTAWATRRRCR